VSYVYERKTELPKVEWSQVVGFPPKDLGLFDLNPTEMMFWMYLPISMPGDHTFHLPPNLRQFIPLIREARWDDMEAFVDNYVYLTAKTLWVEGDYIGNRPGWHCDGFGTDDVNYIWCDRAPTEFVLGAFRVSTDCAVSMQQMEQIGAQAEAFRSITTYPDKHLLRLDRTVMHRSPRLFEPGMRTFVKVSVSKDRYDLIGNSINHEIGELGPMVERQTTRNHPASVQ
jgi:hypothetical protein